MTHEHDIAEACQAPGASQGWDGREQDFATKAWEPIRDFPAGADLTPETLVLMRKIFLSFLTMAVACRSRLPPPPSTTRRSVERRDIVVSARANGAIQPDTTTVEVKSKASGEILRDVGGDRRPGRSAASLHGPIDQRQPRNTLSQAEANLGCGQGQTGERDRPEASSR